MASALIAADLSALYGVPGATGFSAPSTGSLSPALLPTFADSSLAYLPGTGIGWACSGDATSYLSGLTSLRIDGVDYDVTTPASFSGGFTQVIFEPFAFVIGNSYTVELIGAIEPEPYVGPTVAGTVAPTGGVNAFTLSFATSGRASGDRLQILVMSANQAVAAPSGWTESASSPQSRGTAGAAGGVRATLFEKVSNGAEGNVSIPDSGDITWACGLVLRGAGGAAVDVDVSAGNNVAATTSGSFGGVTTTGADRLIVHYVVTDRDNASASWGTPTNADLGNLTEHIDLGTAAGSGGGVAIITGEKRAAGATGNTISTQVASAAYCWITVAYKNSSGGISGTASIAEGADTVAGTSALSVKGASSPIEAADTSTGTSAVLISGVLSASEAADTLVALGEGLSQIQGVAAITEAADSLTATAALAISATLLANEAGDALSSAGVLPIIATASISEAADTLAASGAGLIAGAAIITESADSLSSSAAILISGAATITELSDSATSTGLVSIAGSLNLADADDLADGAADVSVSGSLAIIEADDTVSAFSGSIRTGSASVAEANDGLSASGLHVIAGDLSATEGPDTVASAASVAIVGVVTIAEASDTVSSSSTIALAGSVSITEGNDNLATENGRSGSLSVVEASDNISSTGSLIIQGAAVIVEEMDDTAAGDGQLLIAGHLAANDNDDIVSAFGSVAMLGAGAITEADDAIDASGFAAIFAIPPSRHIYGANIDRDLSGTTTPRDAAGQPVPRHVTGTPTDRQLTAVTVRRVAT